MNCKIGDLAVVVKTLNPVNLGKFVTVIAPLGYMSSGTKFVRDGFLLNATSDRFYWWVEAQTNLIVSNTGRVTKCLHCSDDHLRPIRDTPGKDESLQWLDVPGEKVTA